MLTALTNPLSSFAIFMLASALVMWRLEAMSGRGMAGTALGTLVMPYCSGMGNLMFAIILATKNGPSGEILVNSLVNNVTNMTLLIGLPAMIWGMSIIPNKRRMPKRVRKKHQLNRLSLVSTMLAVLFFSGALWALARDGKLDLSDGLVLTGMFLFWQCFELFDVLRNTVREGKRVRWAMLFVDLSLLGAGAYGLYFSIEALTSWLMSIETGFISVKYLGWLSGWLMVIPNGMLAVYYAAKERADVVYSSQFADGHICIPLCIGLFACIREVPVPTYLDSALLIVCGATVVHLFFVGIFGKLPRIVGGLLVAAYGVFLLLGLS